MERRMALTFLLYFQLIFHAVELREAPNPPHTIRYEPGYSYKYNFNSQFVLNNINVATSMDVDVYIVSEEESNSQQIAIKFTPLNLTWITPEGTSTEQPFDTMDNWFSFYRNSKDQIKTIRHLQSESDTVLALKKTIAQMFALEHVTENETTTYGQHGKVLTQTFRKEQGGSRKHCIKVFNLDKTSCLTSVILTEELVNKRSLHGYNLFNGVTSISNLTLAGKVYFSTPPSAPPINTVISTLTQSTIQTVPLSSIYENIVQLLSCQQETSCRQELSEKLHRLSYYDLNQLIKQITKSYDATTVISLADALVRSGLNNITDLLTQLLNSSITNNSDQLIQRLLYHFTVMEDVLVTNNTVELIKEIINSQSFNESIRRQAILSLGAIARTIREDQPNLSLYIVNYLHNRLTSVTPSVEDTVLIDGIGNSGHSSSQNILHHFVKNDLRINVQHAAIRALRHHHDSKTADLLEETSQMSSNRLVQHAAVYMYHRHPLAKREVLEDMKTRLHRRNAEHQSHTYNTTMPPVHWSTQFGDDDNISISVNRNIMNQFTLQTDSLSTDYKLTIRDDTTFTADLSLSSGPEREQFLQTQVCLDGTLSYNTNMLKDYIFTGTRKQYEEFVPKVDNFIQRFTGAYDAIATTQSSYSTLVSNFSTTLSLVESEFTQTFRLLSQFYTALDSIPNTTELKSNLYNLSLNLNTSLYEIYSSFTSTRASIPTAVGRLSYDLLSSLTPSGQPFTTSSLFLPYIRYAPQTALANIYELYWNTQRGLTQLQTDIESFKRLTGKFGPNRVWTNPSLSLWEMSGNINDIHDMITIRTSSKLYVQNYEQERNQLLLLSSSITNYLQPALNTLLQSSQPLYSQVTHLDQTFYKTNLAFDQLTRAYEFTRSSLDTIFGQVVHPGFPIKYKSCDSNGCGSYPSTSGGLYRAGIDLQITAEDANTVIAPFSGYIKLFNTSSLEDSNSTQYYYNSTNTVVLRMTEFSLESFYIVLSNINPSSDITDNEAFVKGGTVIGVALTQGGGLPTVHMEAYKLISTTSYAVNPSQFIPHSVDPSVTVNWNCNEIVTMIRGNVISTLPILTSNIPPSKVLIGDTLIDIDIPHEFPHPFDLVLQENREITSQNDVLLFTSSSTSLTIGPIPVTFSFTSYGHYRTNVSIEAQLLSKQLQIDVTPSAHASVNGTMRVGTATYALVEIKGTLIDTTLPLIVKQNFSSWPLIASSSMDFITKETDMNMTTKLARITGTGPLSGEEILNYQVQWQYSIPFINRSEYEQTGSTRDMTPPSFILFPYQDTPTCRVIQIIGRKYSNPAFELEFSISEPESVVQVSYQVGTYDDGNDVIVETSLYGNRIVLPHALVQEKRLYFTIFAENSNGLSASTTCRLPLLYDSSPPLASIIPIATHTSHLSQFEVLLSLFDESSLLSDVQEISISTCPFHDDLVAWRSVNISVINSLPEGSGLDLYSFPRNGRFIQNIITMTTDIDTPLSCSQLCNDHTHCLSFDHSVSQKRCVLHDNIVGPSSLSSSSSFSDSFIDGFKTEPLQISSDFKYYEKLGSGNSTVYVFNDLALSHQRAFYINLRLTDYLGYTNTLSSELVSVDVTPPKPNLILNSLSDILVNEGCGFNEEQTCDGPTSSVANHRIIIDGQNSATVFNGPIQLYDELYTRASTFMTANWADFTDRESGLSSYTWCISSSTNYTCDILSSTDPHGGQEAQYWTNTGLAKLSFPDSYYYITVDAINSVTYGGSLVTTARHSVPYIVDTTPPVVSSFELIHYDSQSNLLNVSYTISDGTGSGVNEVSLAIGTTKDDTNILPWTTLPPLSGMVQLSASIPDGVNGWVKLQVTDKVALRGVSVLTTPINVDRSPPITGTLYDTNEGEDDIFEDINYQSNITYICISWKGFSDPHSSIDSYKWKVGLALGDNSTVELRNLTESEIADRMSCEYGLSLVHGVTYYSTLVVTNGVQLSGEASSNGITIDTTPPMAGRVRDGYTDYSNSLTHASFSWEGFTDAQSPIQYYKLFVFRRPINSLSQRLVHSEILHKITYSSNHFSFTNGDYITAIVEAYNSAGLSVNGSSTGYLIDLTPPLLTYLVDGIDPNTDRRYQSSTDSLTVSWSARDPQSAISQIDIAFFQLTEGIRTRIYPNPALGDQSTITLSPTVTNYTTSGTIDLNNGVKYICQLTLTNGAGLSAVYETNGVTIDTIPPVIPVVNVQGEEHGSIISTGSMVVRGEWLGTDEGSGIDRYSVAILNNDDVIVSKEYSIGSGVISGLNLTKGNELTGPFYKLRVIAFDDANLSSEPVESMPFWVTGEDSIGIVNDGFISQVDTVYTDEIYSVSASFKGFISRDCMSGFVRYLWAIGHADDREAVLPFTEQGIVLTNEGTGHAQIYLPDLDQFDSSLLLVTFRGITGCGQIFDSVSDGFILSFNSPTISVLETGPYSIESPLQQSQHQTYQSISSFSSSWSINEGRESVGDLNTVVSIGSYPGGSDLMNSTEAPFGYLRDYVRGIEGTPNYITVSTTNSAGLTGVRYSQPLVLDTTLPPNGIISCTQVLQTSCTQASPWQLSCTWNGTYDPQSGIKRYNISLSTDKLDQSRIHFQELSGSVYSYLSSVLTIATNRQYYVTLYIENGAGLVNILTSMLPSCDNTRPLSSGGLKIVPNYGNGSYNGDMITDKVIDTSLSAVCLLYTSSLSLTFLPFTDTESGMKEYQLGIGTSQGRDDIMNYSVITPTSISSNLYSITGLAFNNSYKGPVYFTVRGINNALLHTDLTSNPVYIKAITNTGESWVYDGPNSLVDIDFQNTTTYISGSFHYGVNCPLRSLQWAVEGTDGIPVKNFTDILISDVFQTDFVFSTDQIRLYNEETYRLILRGIDYSNEVHIFRSNGTSVTLQLPQIGDIADANPLDLVFQESDSSLTLHITSFGDGSPQQQILFYEAAVGSDPNYIATRSDIVPFTNIGLQTTFTFTNLSLVSFQPYYITVRAHSVSGSIAQVSSNGIIPGYGREITAGNITQPLFQFNRTFLSVHWSHFISDVPILYYEWAISNHYLNYSQLLTFCNNIDNDFTSELTRGFENVQLSTYATSSRLNLQHGISYYVLIRALDQGGKCKTTISDTPTLIDTTPPIGNSSIIGPKESYLIDSDEYIAYVLEGSNLEVQWDEFIDSESSVKSYQVGLFELLSCETFTISGSPIINYIPTGLQTSYIFSELHLASNVTYAVKISATNRAGLTGTILSQPIMLDDHTLMTGNVKDGINWSTDVVFQNDLNSLSGVISLAYIQPYNKGVYSSTPCSPSHTYTLTDSNDDWTNIPSSTIDGLSAIRYEATQVSIDTRGTSITTRLDTEPQVVSGIYSTRINSSLTEGSEISISIQAGINNNDLQPFLITSVLFIDDMETLADYDTLLQPFSTSFNAIGLQLHNSYVDNSGRFNQQKLVLWSREEELVQSVTSNVSIDLSQEHRYTFKFKTEQLGLTFRRKVEVYVDDILFLSLFGIPELPRVTSRMILHVFNRHGNIPPCDPVTCSPDPPQVSSIFSNVLLHLSSSTGVCSNGRPFYSWGSPIVMLEAGVGTQPGYTDVKDFEAIYSPCIPCQSVPCFQYGCSPSCPPGDDPEIISFTFTYNNDSDNRLPSPLQPRIYYISARATTASSQLAVSTSNGVLIDRTPPLLSRPIQHYDVSFSSTQPTNFQGNNHTISASWSFNDPESGIIEYQWAIGTSISRQDIQNFTSVGLSTRVENDDLDLIPNTVYYISVLAKNGAGLNKIFTSDGIKYLLIELNQTMLDLVTNVQHTDTLRDVNLNGQQQSVFISNHDDSAGVEWSGIPPNISSVFWYIGSEPLQSDIFPITDVSYNNGRMATITEGTTLYIDGQPFSNISDILSVADGSDPNSIEGLFFEPGRLFFHTLEFCTFAHNCEKSDPRAAIIIRQKDAQQRLNSVADISVTLTQTNPIIQNISVLDNNYTLTLSTSGGIQPGSMLYAGFLSYTDVRRTYRVQVPYISDPYTTLGSTSRDIARRLVGVGGPSFYVSLIGQDNLNSELTLNVSFDATLDWSETEPRLVYWDIDESIWREVRTTCGTESRVDYITGTISVDVCSTALPGVDTSNRPSTLTRRRRESMMTNSTLSFLDRPVHFVVMSFGNFSLNTPPRLQLPTLVELNEDVSSFTYTIPYSDSEGDAVLFYLRSVPKIGTASIDSTTGVLTYTPCGNCTGIDNLQIYIVERELEFGTELTDTGVLQLRVNNIDDRLDIFIYDSSSTSAIHQSNTITVYVPANTSQPVVIARIGTYDVDGYNDDMEIYVTQGINGTSDYRPWIDVVSVPESLPVEWGDLPVGNFTGYVAFLGVNVTYVPKALDFIGTDRLTVYSQQEDTTLSSYLYIQVQVIPSWCINGGVCNGSIADDTCSNITARINDPSSYTCTCPSGFTGDYCQIVTGTPNVVTPVCPNNIPVFNCGGNPCDGASCPGHPTAVCVPDYCGHCQAQWYIGEERVTCTAANSSVCYKPQSGFDPICPTLSFVPCNCPTEHYTCPEDSVYYEQRINQCCVTYTCQCPNISCPYLMDCGHGLQPIPTYRGGKYPGRCCPDYTFEDINECEDPTIKTCTDICVNEQPSFSCQCPSGKSLASDKRTCGVCRYGGLEYLYGDTVKIGCNWCVCQNDTLSGERWHCTADSCTPGCYHDGVHYDIGSQLNSVGSISCTCRSTDKYAEWSCN